MKVKEVRKKYIEFFKATPRKHSEISPAPLVLPEDPSTLFTSSGMQQLVPYLKGEPHPEGKRLVDSQPSIRAQGINDDIDEVGDNRHFTYFEMLGNWSLGDYFKKEQLAWYLEFLVSKLGIPKERLWASVFKGDDLVAKDTESAEIWEGLGFSKDRIHYFGAEKNWWSRSGPPSKMPPGEIGGPDSEVFFEFTDVKHDPKFGKKCDLSCDCGRFLEIGNSVFIQYEKQKDGSLKELPQKNVDFGGGLERIAAAVNNLNDVYKIDVFRELISKTEKKVGYGYEDNPEKSNFFRIVVEHARASRALINEGVEPANKLHGYVLRRLIRRATLAMRNLKGEVNENDLSVSGDRKVDGVIKEEVGRFLKTLEKGLKEIKVIKEIDAKRAFNLYQTYGFPLDLTREIFAKKGQRIDKKQFDLEFDKHKKLSRTASAGMFKGGLADKSEEVTKLHTATHLLHAALRRVLGEHVQQKGSNITSERLRFDFTHKEKLKNEEVKKVEKLINEQIEKDLAVSYETMTYKNAIDEGALAFFGERYGEKVKVYTIGDSKGVYFSKEVCGGPHVKKTSEIGRVKIKKQEKIGAGLVRVYAFIDSKK